MKKVIISIVGVLAVLFAVAAAGLWWFQTRFVPISFTEGAAGLIAIEASNLFQSDPATSQERVDQMIKSQHEASNINLKIDSDGKAVDLFGTAFRVEHHVDSGTSITTVTSAGPDREFGTGDDITGKHEREMEHVGLTSPFRNP